MQVSTVGEEMRDVAVIRVRANWVPFLRTVWPGEMTGHARHAAQVFGHVSTVIKILI
jgi:hypothetical protein